MVVLGHVPAKSYLQNIFIRPCNLTHHNLIIFQKPLFPTCVTLGIMHRWLIVRIPVPPRRTDIMFKPRMSPLAIRLQCVCKITAVNTKNHCWKRNPPFAFKLIRIRITPHHCSPVSRVNVCMAKIQLREDTCKLLIVTHDLIAIDILFVKQ